MKLREKLRFNKKVLPYLLFSHDFNRTVSLPITLGERWSAATLISYSALLGKFRDFQFQDPREVLLGTSGSPATLADTLWGGDLA